MKAKIKALLLLLVLCMLLFAGPAAAEDCVKANAALRQGLAKEITLPEKEVYFAKASALCPSLAEAHYNYGVVLLKQQKNTEARQRLQNAMRLLDEPEVRLALAYADMAVGNYKEAERNLALVVATDSQNVNALQALAYVERRTGKLEEAEKVLLRAFQVDPRRASLFYEMGLVLLAQNRAPEATESFLAAIEREPRRLEPYRQIFLLLQNADRLPELNIVFEKPLKNSETPPDVFLWVATALSSANQLNAAADVLSQYQGQSADVSAMTALIHFRQGKKKQAVAELESTTANEAASPITNGVLGWMYLQQGLEEKAQPLLEDAAARDASNPFILNNLGVLLERKGEVDKAFQFYSEAQELSPDFAEAQANRGRLEGRAN